VISDTANRAFLALAALALLAYTLAGLGACALLAFVAYRFAVDGAHALTTGGMALALALVFLALTGAGALRGLWSLRCQLNATEALADSVRAARLPRDGRAGDVAARVGIRRLDIVAAAEPFSFTYGSFFPRVATSRGLLDALSPPELQAVLEHERYHVKHLDPLKVLLARVFAAAFFYMPVLRDLRRRYVAGRELAADRRAVSACGTRALAGALAKVVGSPAWADLRTAAAIGDRELLDVRITQLETGREPILDPVSRTTVALSVLGGGLLLTGLGLAGVASDGIVMPDPWAGWNTPLQIVGIGACSAFWAWVSWRVGRSLWRRWSRA
jgi:Zn-dependent protease with chaperone function